MTMRSCRQLAAKISFCSWWLHKTSSGFCSFFFLSGKKTLGAWKLCLPQIPCAARSIFQLCGWCAAVMFCDRREVPPCVHRPREPSGGKTCSISAGTTASPRKFCSTAAWCDASSLGPLQTPKVEYPPPQPYRIFVLIKQRYASPWYYWNHRLFVRSISTHCVCVSNTVKSGK